MEKNRLEKVRKQVFYKHMNIVTKNGGKAREKYFPEKHSFRKQTTMEKNRLEKVRKYVFYKHTNIVTKKWGENTRENFFSKNTRISRVKKNGEKSSWKKCENTFFI